ncbi:MAG: MBL fold metallo-hydrolase [Actinobacteria bacterium]|nr:MBL fold metallo-hydrolase [Actinomycetota bacterium]
MADFDRYFIHERVYQIGGPKLSSVDDCCVYLVDGNGPLALIDTGCGPSYELLIANIKSLDLEPEKIESIILTHCHIDHTGGASKFQEEFGSRITTHEEAARPLETGDGKMTAASLYGIELGPLRIDEKLSGKENSIQIGDLQLNIIHTPGHTPCSVCVYLDIYGTRILFGQDIHGPFHPDFGSDIEQWKKSMERLLTLNADILCEGHFGIYRPGASARDYIESCLEQY